MLSVGARVDVERGVDLEHARQGRPWWRRVSRTHVMLAEAGQIQVVGWIAVLAGTGPRDRTDTAPRRSAALAALGPFRHGRPFRDLME